MAPAVAADAARRRYRCCCSWHRPLRRTYSPDRPRSPAAGGGGTSLPTLPPLWCSWRRRGRRRPTPATTGEEASWLRRPTRRTGRAGNGRPRTENPARRNRWRRSVPSWRTPRSALATLVAGRERGREESGGAEGSSNGRWLWFAHRGELIGRGGGKAVFERGEGSDPLRWCGTARNTDDKRSDMASSRDATRAPCFLSGFAANGNVHVPAVHSSLDLSASVVLLPGKQDPHSTLCATTNQDLRKRRRDLRKTGTIRASAA